MNAIPEVIEDGEYPVVSHADWDERDGRERNWDISVLRNDSGYMDAFRAVVEEMRLKIDVVTP
jgi:hypothetical protein